MPVIAVVGNKGGAGKTTLTINLAALASNGHSVVILDADPQQSSSQWREIASSHKQLKVMPATEDVHASLLNLADSYDYCFIDCPPSVHAEQMHAALKVCDLAVIPVQPSPLDIWATVHIEEAIEKAREDNPELRALLVINQLESRTKLSKIMRQAMNELSLPAAETVIKRRAAYRNSFLEGRAAVGQRLIAAELTDLLNEIKRCL